MSEYNIKLAYAKGYRATESGDILGIYKDKLKLGEGSNGYLLFRIRDGDKLKTIAAHRFCAFCYYGDELFQHECVRHKNGDKTDNRKENIELGSYSENFRDIEEEWRKSFSLKGAASRRKLTASDVKEIREMLFKGESYRAISNKFGVSKTSIQQIKEGKSYKWVI